MYFVSSFLILQSDLRSQCLWQPQPPPPLIITLKMLRFSLIPTRMYVDLSRCSISRWGENCWLGLTTIFTIPLLARSNKAHKHSCFVFSVVPVSCLGKTHVPVHVMGTMEHHWIGWLSKWHFKNGLHSVSCCIRYHVKCATLNSFSE